MIEFAHLTDFSRNNCIAICAFLVPANLTFTVLTLSLLGLRRSSYSVRLSVSLAITVAMLMCFHVATWFEIGVVRMETYILLTLGATCLGVNLIAVFRPQFVQQVLDTLRGWVRFQQRA